MTRPVPWFTMMDGGHGQLPQQGLLQVSGAWGGDWQSRGLMEAGQAWWQGFCVLGNNDTPCHVLWSLLLHGLKWSCELNPLQLDLVSQAVSVMAEALAVCREPRYILERQACLCPRWRFINMIVTSLAPLETSATLRLAFRAMAPQQVACCSEYLPALFTCFQTQVPFGAASRTHVAWWEPVVVTSHQASVFLYLEGKQVILANWVIWEDGKRLWLRRHTFQIYVQMWLLLASGLMSQLLGHHQLTLVNTATNGLKIVEKQADVPALCDLSQASSLAMLHSSPGKWGTGLPH